MKSQILNLKFQIVAMTLVVAMSPTLHAQQSYPMLMALDPLAVQAGGEPSEHTVSSRYNLGGAFQVFVSGDGVAAEAVPDPKADPEKEQTKLKLRFTAKADALPGVRDFRIATPQGLSTIGQVIVVGDPVVVETPKNDVPEKATVAKLPATLCGGIETAEDVDYFKFAVKEGETLSFHVRSARVEDKIHDLQAHVDPIIALKNASGTVLAAGDNYFFGDPALSYTFKQAGDYYLEVRDVRYQGNPYWQYCIEVNDRPLVVTVLPSVVRSGWKSAVELIGFNVPAGVKAELDVPADLAPGLHWLSPVLGKEKLTPVPVVVEREAPTVESSRPHNTPETAEDVSLPTVVAGRLAMPGEADCYAFAAKKGEAFTFSVTARRAQSSLDSILAVYDEKKKRLKEADDDQFYRIQTSDSNLEGFVAPADGRYVVEIRDLHQRGGPQFTYALKLERAEPHFTLHADVDKVIVAGGTLGCTFVRAVRKNGFTGPIELFVDGLPPGIRAECGRVLGDGQDGVIIFRGDDGLKPTAIEVQIVGRAVHKGADGKEVKLSAVAQPWQETYMPGGGRGSFPVDSFFVATCKPLDITKITVSPTEINLKPGESKKIEISIERAEGFDKSVTLDLLYRHLARPFGDSLPKGVTIDEKQSKTICSGKTLSGHITLTAAKDAPAVEDQLVPVMAQVAINFVMKMCYCGEPLHVTVAP